MTRKTILTLGAAATAAAIAAVAIPALAGGWGPHDRMMQTMHGDQAGVMQDAFMQDAFMQDGRGPGMTRQRGAHGPMGRGGPADSPLHRAFDADADGTVTAAELEAGIAALHAGHDADGTGALSPDEFAALFAAIARDMAERPFTLLDTDRSGEISAEEMAVPARRMARMRLMHVNDAETEER